MEMYEHREQLTQMIGHKISKIKLKREDCKKGGMMKQTSLEKYSKYFVYYIGATI